MFISVDFVDRNLGVIMQAEPKPQPFIGSTPGKYRVDLSVDLPPLVPGIYWLKFWIGTHNTRTVDNIRQAVAFEIVDNPSASAKLSLTPPITGLSSRRLTRL